MAQLKNNIILTPLKIIPVNGGDVLHGIKETDINFQGFGELYFSWIKKNIVRQNPNDAQQ